MLPPRIARLLALGALGVTFALVLLFAFLVWLTIPRTTGGIDRTEAILTWIACGGAIVGLIAVHLVLARQLWDNRPRPL